MIARAARACVAAVLAFAPMARAADKAACVAAYEEGQRLRKDGKLVAARERLLTCAQEDCPAVLRRDCTQWVGEIEGGTPTIVLEAVDPEGHDLVEVRVALDGAPLAARLDGKAIPLDPGPHVLRLEAGGEAVEERVLAREGDKNRRVRLRIGAPRAPERPPVIAVEPRRAGVPAATWILGGLGVAGLGTFAAFGALGLAQKGELDGRGCKPDCPAADVDRMKRRFLVADVGLGVGLAALAGAAAFYFARGDAPGAPVVAVGAAITPGGAGATLSSSF